MSSTGHMSQWGKRTAGVAVVLLLVGALAVALKQGQSTEDRTGPASGAAPAKISKEIEQRAQARQRRLASPAARAERERSRTAYTHLDRRGVARLVSAAYPATVRQVESTVQPDHVRRYTSDYTAIVDSGPGAQAAGGSALAISSFPLRNVSASGKREPTDLTLRARDGGFEAVNPLADFSLPADLGHGIRLPGDIPLSISSGDPSGVAPSKLGSSAALYPEVDTDTDLFATSTPRGIELFRLLRSPHSPSTQELRLDLPEGASLEAIPNGGARVVRDGRPLLSIAAPTAADSQGSAVPVTMQVVGDGLRVSVSRGDDDWAYPIVVDPAIDSYQWSDFPGWVGFNTGNYSLNGDCMFGRSCFGPGLNIYAWQGQWYSGGAYAGFGYRAPATPGVFVARATLGWVGYYNGESLISPYMYAGLWDQTYGQNAWQAVYYSWWFGTIDLNRLGDSPNLKEVNVQLTNVFDHHAGGDHHAYVGSATIYLDDVDSPGFGSIKRPPWVDQQPATIPLTVSDAGLGISSITISQPGGPSWQTSVGCAGGNRNPCPRTWSSPANGEVNYDPSVLPQGVNNLPITAMDAAGHVSPGTNNAQVRVDHTPPSLSLSGTLAVAAEGGQ